MTQFLDAAQRVFVIEDDPVQRKLYGRVLGGGTYSVVGFGSPAEFFTAQPQLQPPDLMLIDVLLPGMDGLSVTARLEQDPLWCVVPVILMTASPTPDLVRASQRLPVPPEGFLAKPADPRAILRLVRTVIAAEDPAHLLRKLQRHRLSLTISLQCAIREIAEAETIVGQQLDAPRRFLEVRRELQEARVTEKQVGGDASSPIRRNLAARIQQLTEESSRLRREVEDRERRQKEMLSRRNEATRMQKALRDLEGQIEYAQTLVRKASGPARTSFRPGPAGGASADAGDADELVIHSGESILG